MAGIAASGIVLEPLTRDNYDNWSCLVKNYLVGHDLWGVVLERIPTADETDQIWKMKNGKALHIIQLACGSENLVYIRDFHTARDAFNYFRALYGPESYTMVSIVQSDIEQGVIDDSLHQYKSLHRFIESGNWNDAEAFMKRDETSMFSMSSSGRSILHVAAIAGHEEIVKKLVKEGKDKLVKMKDNRGYTALALVAELTGKTKVAKWMVENKGEKVVDKENLLSMKTNNGETPLFLAAAKGHKEMTSYLFYITDPLEFTDNNYHNGSLLFTRCINAEIFDVALYLLQRFPRMPLAFSSESRYEFDVVQPLYALARMPHVFPSSSTYGFIQGFLYKVLRLPEEELVYDRKTRTEKRELHKTNFAGRRAGQILKHIHILFQNLVLLKFSGIREIYNQKINHRRVLEILDCWSEKIQEFNESQLREASAYDAMLQAAKNGNIEFIDAMRKAKPNLLWAIDKNERCIFSHAILNRRKAVFQLIHDPTVIGSNGPMEIVRSSKDVFGNSLLHLAGCLEPSSSQRRHNPALQIQKEILWFQAVEKVVHPMCKGAKNAVDKKPYEIFTESHQELLNAGEKWIKETASSYITVGSIVVTLMFAALFTIPGGNNEQIGTPVILDEFYFKTFILADAVSIIASATSLLVFNGILTSRYAEIDFLKVLFLKLLRGILLLVLSVCSMMVAFYAALNMILKGKNIGSRWSVLGPILVLGSFPITIVLVSQLRFMYNIFHSTIKNPISSI